VKRTGLGLLGKYAMSEKHQEPLPPLTKVQEARVAQLTDAELQIIDQGLLSNTSIHWRKVARVVGSTMLFGSPTRIEGIPDIFYAQRVRKLVESGILESMANLDYIGYSEVRIPKQDKENGET
jgi:hypothetical protein